jgi:hypothetical protein
VSRPEGADSAIAGVAIGHHGTKMQFGIAFGKESRAVPVPEAGAAEVLGYRNAFRFSNDVQVFNKRGKLAPNPRFKTAKQWDELAEMELEMTDALCIAATGDACKF